MTLKDIESIFKIIREECGKCEHCINCPFLTNCHLTPKDVKNDEIKAMAKAIKERLKETDFEK